MEPLIYQRVNKMFIKDTKILSNNENEISISTVKTDDMISGWNFDTNQVDMIKINNLIAMLIPEYIKISIGDKIICCSTSTPFYTLGGWACYDITKPGIPVERPIILTKTSALLNAYGEYEQITNIEKIEEEIPVISLDTDDQYDTFIVEGFVVHNLPTLISHMTITYAANTVNFATPYSRVSEFNWWFNKNDGNTVTPPITPTVTNTGFSYPTFQWSNQNGILSNGGYSVIGQL